MSTILDTLRAMAAQPAANALNDKNDQRSSPARLMSFRSFNALGHRPSENPLAAADLRIALQAGVEGEGECGPDAADLLDRYDERAAIVQFDGGQDRPRAEARAWNEVASLWHHQHGTRTSSDLCAGCGKPLAGSAVRVLPRGNTIHGYSDDRCLLAYGRQ